MHVPGSCPAPWVATVGGGILVTVDLWSDLVQPLASSYVTVAKNPLCIHKTPRVDPVLRSWLGTSRKTRLPIFTGSMSCSACLLRAFKPAAPSPLCLFQIVRFWLWTPQSPEGCFLATLPGSGRPCQPLSSLLTAAFGSLPGCPSGTFKASQGDEGCVHCPINSRTTSEGATNCVCRNGYYRADADPVDMPCTSMWALGNWGGAARGWERRYSSVKAPRDA